MIEYFREDENGNRVQTFPAKELGEVIPGTATAAEQERLKQLDADIAKQQAWRATQKLIEVGDDEDATGAMDLTGVKGYVSREEGNAKRMRKALEYKARRREEYRREAVALFTARRNMINFTELVMTVKQCQRRTG